MRILFLSFFLINFLFVNAQQLDHVQGEFLVRLKPETDIQDFQKSLQTYRIRMGKKISPHLNIWKLHFDFTQINEYDFLKKIRQHPAVEVAQFNHLVEDRIVPDDLDFNLQWNWLNIGNNGGLTDADIDADLAWDITTGGVTADGDTIVIAIIDSGIDLDHPDLEDNLWHNYAEIPDNGLDDDNNGYVDDFDGWNFLNNSGNVQVTTNGHGVRVAGLVGAVGNNGIGITGINWNIKIMTIKRSTSEESEVIAAYSYALDARKRYNESQGTEGAFVVATNSSWGVNNGDPADVPLWCAFYDTLGAYGILNCGATSNSNVDVDVVGDLPTTCPSDFMIAVTATDNADIRNNTGYGLVNIDVAAPGINIYTTSNGGNYQSTNGTSVACPIVAGMIGLIYATPCSNLIGLAKADPEAAALLAQSYLYDGIDAISSLQNEIATGGRVNAYNSLSLIEENCGSCPLPVGLNASGVTDTAAELSWFTNENTVDEVLEWRLAGSQEWTMINNPQKPYLLNGLSVCTSYEFRIQAFCSDTVSDYSNTYIFKTDGCCEPPTSIIINDIAGNSALLTWNSVLAANSYSVVLESETGTETFADILDVELALNSLIACTDYSISVQTVCDTGVVSSVPIPFSTVDCGNCIDFAYCPSSGDNVNSEWIDSIRINTLENGSGSNDGYGDFTDLNTTLNIGDSYAIRLVPGYTATVFSEYFRVWIDYNQNGEFDDPEERAFDTEGTTQGAVNGSILIPEDALTGFTRMRVSMRFLNGILPCATFDFGEVEDYCVTLVPTACPNPNGIDTISVTSNSASIFWNESDSAETYYLVYKSITDTVWQEVITISPEYTLSDLLDCTEYIVEISSVCENSMSNFSIPFTFTTDCIIGIEEVINTQNINIYPNPVAGKLTIDFELLQKEKVSIEVINTIGQTRYYLPYGELAAGSQSIQLSDLQLSSGIYFIKINTDKGSFIKKIISL